MSHCSLTDPIPLLAIRKEPGPSSFLVEFHMLTPAMLCECYGVVTGFDDGEASQAEQ